MKMNNNIFWTGKKVLVTGHTGYVGTWLSLVLQLSGANTIGFSLPEEEESLYSRIKNQIHIETYYGDLRDKECIKECVREKRPDIFFHLAAYGFVQECFADPERAYSVNVQGTLNMLNAIRETDSVQCVIIASSDKVYRNEGLEGYLFKETDPLGGIDTYSASKTCEDILAQSFFQTYLEDAGVSMCILRPSNILGPGDFHMNRLVPSIFNAYLDNRKPEIRNPGSVRPWQNILDVTDAYLCVAERMFESEGLAIYNVGPEENGICTTGQIADFIGTLFENKIGADKEPRDSIDSVRVREQEYLGLDITKIKKDLDWIPRRTLQETLKEIYQFILDDDDHYTRCVKLIEEYYD